MAEQGYFEKVQNDYDAGTDQLYTRYLDDYKGDIELDKQLLVRAGVRRNANCLIYPITTLFDNTPVQYQTIYPTGNGFEKRFAGNSNGQPVCQIFGSDRTSIANQIYGLKSGTIVLCESLTKACALYQALHSSTRCIVLNCLNSNGIAKVAEAIHVIINKKNISLIIAADNDCDKPSNDKNGRELIVGGLQKKIHEICVKYQIPLVKPPVGYKDFDDFYGSNIYAPSEIIELIDKAKPVCENPLNKKVLSLNFDPTDNSAPDWVIEGLLLRGYISVLSGAGGSSKSLLSLSIAISVAIGEQTALSGFEKPKQANVLVLNNEDDDLELQRRISAITGLFGINLRSLLDKLYIISGYQEKLLFAYTDERSSVLETPLVQYLIEFIKVNNIGVLIVDPFISIHSVNENDNNQIEKVMSIFRFIAGTTNCAIQLVHHIRKSGQDTEVIAGDAESSRGAKALIDACRISHTLAKMSNKTASHLGIPPEVQARLVRFDVSKSNFAPSISNTTWLLLESVSVGQHLTAGAHRSVLLETFGTKPTSERKRNVIDLAVRTMISKLGVYRSGMISSTEFIPAYKDQAQVGNTTVHEDITRLPRGEKNSAIHVFPSSGDQYRIWYEPGRYKTAPKMIHLQSIN
ncbi:hypothetical protein FE810_03400 [Thalassotalea litorea]|uniref:Toprim domain-containing protein n=1 Tax=Thalassotalea litorea TaxID=2020715 RepID=A0A5R9IVF7_9GAMM|nr:AAA family ATPase [Thalassotalea litorea]TLU67341.1 hypothetical protein FE810_03400 [Thalassotalea litorea]